MAISTDILRTWRGPRAVIRGMLGQGPREDRLIMILMVGCFLMFVAQLPVLARLAFESQQLAATDPDYQVRDLQMLIGSAFFGWLMVVPLVLYLVAGLSYAIMRIFTRRITGHGARLALFWALLAASPVALLLGLLSGLNGPTAGATVVFVLWAVVFVVFWVQGLRESLAEGAAR
jgi:uncharacterized oligopeptide transporter (OPT) family protein